MRFFMGLFIGLVACGGSSSGLGVNGEVSECGGFGLSGPAGPPIPQETGHAYSECADDVIEWSHDSSSQTLSFLNKGVFLNCCGDHAISVALESGVYVITESDEPESGDARCGCMCMFDYAVDIPNLSGDSVDIKVQRNITDASPALSVIWEGSLDLTQGSGQEMIEEDAGWCDEGE